MLISCLMPTRDRRPYVPLAITSFLNQTHPDRELIILDDGTDNISDLLPDDPRIFHVRADPPPRTTGQKRNQLVQLARGTICCNFDDDDWSSPHRLAHQLETLTTSNKSLTGLSSFYYWDTTTQTAWLWKFPATYPPAPGSSQMFLRTWALKNPYRPINIPEDYHLEQAARLQQQLTSEPGTSFLVSRWHGANTWRTPPRQRGYTPAPRTALPQQFLIDAELT